MIPEMEKSRPAEEILGDILMTVVMLNRTYDDRRPIWHCGLMLLAEHTELKFQRNFNSDLCHIVVKHSEVCRS